jgi:hypothetical protein
MAQVSPSRVTEWPRPDENGHNNNQADRQTEPFPCNLVHI